MGAEPQRLHVAFFPFMAAGHMIPTLDIAKLFATHNVKVTIITTPKNAPFFTKPLENYNIAPPIDVEIIPFPSQEAGLPNGVENFDQFNTMEMSLKFCKATKILQESLENVIMKCKPNCLVADLIFPYATDVAFKFNIPRLVFHGSNYFSQCVTHAMFTYEPYKSNLLADDDEFVIPNLPHEIKLTKKNLPEMMRGEVKEEVDKEWMEVLRVAFEAEEKSYGIIVNTFYELEKDYVDYYKNVMGRKSWHIGPASLCNREIEAKFQRGKDSSIDKYECMKWLDSKRAKSVVYVCFGSLAEVTSSQLREIALGLENSEQDFVWVVRRSGEDEDWLPYGFEERMKGKGLIIRGWAPQVLILDHEAIGAFVTHCGWNSTLEGISCGVPLVTWPVFAEQFYNEKLVTEILKIGISIGAKEWNRVVDGKKKEDIEVAIRRVMVGEECLEIRSRAKEVKELARKAVEVGGSSYSNLTCLIQELSSYNSR